jgi:hypothetical protein
MCLLHTLIQTLIHRGMQLFSTSIYLLLAKVCRLYYIGRYSTFIQTLILLTHQLSCRSPQNSPKVQKTGTLHDTLKINTLIFPLTSFIFLVRQLPLALTSKGNALQLQLYFL